MWWYFQIYNFCCQDKARKSFRCFVFSDHARFFVKKVFNRKFGHILQKDWSNECGNWAPAERANCTNDWQKVDAVRPSFNRVRRPFFSYYFSRKLRAETKMLAGAGAKNRLVTWLQECVFSWQGLLHQESGSSETRGDEWRKARDALRQKLAAAFFFWLRWIFILGGVQLFQHLPRAAAPMKYSPARQPQMQRAAEKWNCLCCAPVGKLLSGTSLVMSLTSADNRVCKFLGETREYLWNHHQKKFKFPFQQFATYSLIAKL